MRRLRFLTSLATLALTALLAIPATGSAEQSLPEPTGGPQIAVEPAECARMLADDGVRLLRLTSRKALRRGPEIKLYAFQPGRNALKITLRRKGDTVAIARAEARFDAAGTRTVRLRITEAGRRALAGRGKLTLRVRATATPDAAPPAAATRVVHV